MTIRGAEHYSSVRNHQECGYVCHNNAAVNKVLAGLIILVGNRSNRTVALRCRVGTFRSLGATKEQLKNMRAPSTTCEDNGRNVVGQEPPIQAGK